MERPKRQIQWTVLRIGLLFFLWAVDAAAQMPIPITFYRPKCGGGVSLVQQVPGVPGTYITSTKTASQTLTETAGHLIVAMAYSGQGSCGGTPNMTFSVSDTLGNTYYPGSYYASPPYSAVQIFYAANVIGGANTVTVTANGSREGCYWTGLFVSEYAGLATTNVVDVSSGQAAPSSVQLTTPGAVNALSSCDLAVGVFVDGNIFNGSISAGSGYTLREADNYAPAGAADNLPSLATAGSSMNVGINDTAATNFWVAAQMSFRAASTGAPSQPTKLAFTTAGQTLANWVCSGIVTVQSQNVSGVPTNSSTGITLNLSGSGMTYFADSNCQYPITSTILGAGTNTKSFYFMATDPSSNTVTVGATGFTSINQTETINLNAKVWVGGVSCNGNWNTAACWRSGVPGASDIAHFDSTCTLNCAASMNVPVSVAGLWLHPGFTGSVSQSTNTLTVSSTVEVDAGTFNFGSNSSNISGLMVIAGGAVNAGTGTINTFGGVAMTGGTYTGSSGSQNFQAPFNMNGGTFNGGSGPITLSGNFGFNLAGGTFTSTSGSLTLPRGATFSGGVFNHNNGTVVFNPNWGELNLISTPTFYNVIASSPSGAFNAICGTWVIAGTLTVNQAGANLQSGGCPGGTGSLSLAGDLVLTAGAGGTVSVDFNGGNTQNITGTGTFFSGNVTVNKSPGKSVKLGANLTLAASQTLAINKGIFDLNGFNLTTGTSGNITNWDTLNGGSGTLTLGGNWTNSGTFNAGTGTVLLSNANHTFTGPTTFYNLTMLAPTASRTLTFDATSVTTVTNALSLTGASAKTIKLRSSLTPTQWTLTPPGSTTLGGFIDVRDSKSAVAIHSGANFTNSGNNSNWSFP